MFNVGVDFSIFNRLFSVEFDLYQRTRSGLLANRYGSLPNTFGASLPQENLNGDRTQGIEFSLSHEKTFRDFHYVISGNFNLARTKTGISNAAHLQAAGTSGRTRHQDVGMILSGDIR